MKSRSVSPACTQYSRGWCSKQISPRMSVRFCSASVLVMMSGTASVGAQVKSLQGRFDHGGVAGAAKVGISLLEQTDQTVDVAQRGVAAPDGEHGAQIEHAVEVDFEGIAPPAVQRCNADRFDGAWNTRIHCLGSPGFSRECA